MTPAEMVKALRALAADASTLPDRLQATVEEATATRLPRGTSFSVTRTTVGARVVVSGRYAADVSRNIRTRVRRAVPGLIRRMP